MMHEVDFEDISQYTTALRREFHRHPELSMQESWTSQRICLELDTLGISYDIVGEKNIIGRLDCGPGKKLAIRADIDALPIQEQVDVPWRSQIEGISHVCGHDGHTAALLGAAKQMLGMKDRLHGTVYFCFQQGEEAGGGAEECVEYLCRQGGVDHVIGVHLYPLHELGVMDLLPGFRACGAVIFQIHIKGKGGHGSRPDLVPNAVTIACDVYQHLISIPSNRHEAANYCVVSPCVIQAGSRFNILPETAEIEGTIRFSGLDDGAILMEKVRNTATQVAALYGGSAETVFSTVAPYPIYNDEFAVSIGRTAATESGFSLLNAPPVSASDNVSVYLHKFPGFYAFVGANSKRPGTTGVNHSPNFDFDEAVLPKIVHFYCECAERFLET